MNCRSYSLLISAQLDGQIRPSERALLNHHLNECEICRHYASDLRQQSEQLFNLNRTALTDQQAKEMQAATMWALQIEARKQLLESRRSEEKKANRRIRLFSRSFAAVTSLLLLLMLVNSILRPAHRAFAFFQAAAQTTMPSDNGDEEIAQLKDLLLPPAPSPRPILDPHGTLIGFTKEVDEEQFAVIALVGADGRASVTHVLEAPTDPEVIHKLSHALNQQANFRPAYIRGKYMPADAILMFSRVTISG
ncbi:MAG: zf-HC2 domain-containing protein [Acidobacteria bacterium]|nr:zf-HC2 domain-containing protein [Acidobacteriota bacterium]